MRIAVLTALAFLAVAAPAQARCAPPPAGGVIMRTPGGTMAFHDGRDNLFACVRGGRAVRIGDVPFDGDYELRLAGGFAALSQVYCDRYDGGCFETRIRVWNLRRGRLSSRRVFSGTASGDDTYAEMVDMELCETGTLATLMRVEANLELWSATRGQWSRLDAAAGRTGHLQREGRFVAPYRDGVHGGVGYGLCARRGA